jgi:hypothetical protein
MTDVDVHICVLPAAVEGEGNQRLTSISHLSHDLEISSIQWISVGKMVRTVMMVPCPIFKPSLVQLFDNGRCGRLAVHLRNPRGSQIQDLKT